MTTGRRSTDAWLTVALVAALAGCVAASIVVPRLRPDPVELFRPASFSLPAPDGYERCLGDYGSYSIALPADWHVANEDVEVACAFADPEPFDIVDGKKTPSTALRVMSLRYDAGADAKRAFTPYNYPDTLKALIDPKLWTVKQNRTVRVAGVPARVVESVAKPGGYYDEGTVLYAYVVAAGARHDKRCARFFVHCHPFIVSTRVASDAAEQLADRKVVVDTAARSLRFSLPRTSTDRHAHLAVECVLDALTTQTGGDGCPADRFARQIAGAPIRRATILQVWAGDVGYRWFIVRVYRGDGANIDRYSDDIVSIEGDETDYYDRSVRWKVERWERGPEFPAGALEDLRLYLPVRDACEKGMYHPSPDGLGKSFNPKALAAVTRQVVADDVLPVAVLKELAMGPTPAERNANPELSSLAPKGVRFGGGDITDGHATVGFGGDDFAGSECLDRLRALAISKTMRQFPGVKNLSFSWTSG